MSRENTNLSNQIQLDSIDTSVAEANFAELLNESKTYFLNGAWGSGKTEYLKKISNKTDIKMIFIDFWQIKDERTAVTIGFSRLHPIWYLITKIATVSAVIMSLLMTNVINLGLTKIFPSWITIASLLALIVAVWQFFKVKSDWFYGKFIIYFLKNKVLVIDDFDRVAPETQKEVYKLFNLLNGKIPIIFVGNYDKITENKDNYLQKIIDRRIELPYVLHSKNIWESYFQKLSKHLDIDLDILKVFKQIVIGEERNLRERKHFNDFVNLEFFKHGKLGHVQLEQQLWVIYVYLFYPQLYKNLVSDEKLNLSSNITEYIKSKGNGTYSAVNLTVEELLIYQIDSLQNTDNKKYPKSFVKDKQSYLIYESSSNLSAKELEVIIANDIQLEKHLLSEVSSDFYQYIVSSYKTFSQEKKERLLKISFVLIKNFESSNIISYIIREKANEIMPPKKYFNGGWSVPAEQIGKTDKVIEDETFNGWDKVLTENDFDLSLKLYFLEKFRIFSFNKLGERFPDINLLSSDYANQKRKDSLILVYLSSNNLWEKFDQWNDEIWNCINSLNDEQYLTFWTIQKLIFNGEEYKNFDRIPSDKKYIVWTKKYGFEPPHSEKDLKGVVEKIKLRLDQLVKNGYSFEYRENDSNKFDDN